jgi:hypothetical protein
MSLTDRLNLVQRHRETGSLNPATSEETWTRRQTSPFTRGTGSLSLAGETTFDQLSRELALDSQTLALVLGMTDLMLERWQRGILQPTGSSLQQLERVKRLHQRLYALFQPYQALAWMRKPNEHLHYQVPVDVLISGGLHRVEAALDHLEEMAR